MELCYSQGILIHDMIGLMLRITGMEMDGENLRREASLRVGLMLVLHSKFRGQNFFNEERM